ncbi:hypothetical protein ABZY03_30540 [Streptomyces klenkii]|uniref:hypothetical protein n=1 Tax=Streptomyces klenkii TaxID=1420899 RepID=UPI0033ADD56C
MSRAHTPGPPHYRSLQTMLPAIYREGDFADRFISGFDDVLAPINEILDCLDAYTHPTTAPRDILDWMLEWSGTHLPAGITEPGRRYALWAGVRLQGLRGARTGLELLATHVLGGHADITDSGGTRYGAWPDEDPTDYDPPHVQVHLTTPAPINPPDLTHLIRDWLPAHTTATITTDTPRPTEAT